MLENIHKYVEMASFFGVLRVVTKQSITSAGGRKHYKTMGCHVDPLQSILGYRINRENVLLIHIPYYLSRHFVWNFMFVVMFFVDFSTATIGNISCLTRWRRSQSLRTPRIRLRCPPPNKRFILAAVLLVFKKFLFHFVKRVFVLHAISIHACAEIPNSTSPSVERMTFSKPLHTQNLHKTLGYIGVVRGHYGFPAFWTGPKCWTGP